MGVKGSNKILPFYFYHHYIDIIMVKGLSNMYIMTLIIPSEYVFLKEIHETAIIIVHVQCCNTIYVGKNEHV